MKFKLLAALLILTTVNFSSAKRTLKSKRTIARIEKRYNKIEKKYKSILETFEGYWAKQEDKDIKFRKAVIKIGKNYSCFRWLIKLDCDLYHYKFELKLNNDCEFLDSVENSKYMKDKEFKKKASNLEIRLQKLLTYVRKTEEYKKELQIINNRNLSSDISSSILYSSMSRR